jgi:cytochrome c biogenesis protein CcmG, thiol:disulfide interchange protein DsbE
MRKILFSLFLASVSIAATAQDGIPSVKVQTLDGKTVNIQDLHTAGKPMIINFWATWCGPCKAELSAIHEVYSDWVDESEVTLVAVSIDDSRTMSRVKPYVDTQGWDYLILLDPER